MDEQQRVLHSPFDVETHKKTFKNSHYSWWRSKAFDIKKAKTIEL